MSSGTYLVTPGPRGHPSGMRSGSVRLYRLAVHLAQLLLGEVKNLRDSIVGNFLICGEYQLGHSVVHLYHLESDFFKNLAGLGVFRRTAVIGVTIRPCPAVTAKQIRQNRVFYALGSHPAS
jgi:hypothetical protein